MQVDNLEKNRSKEFQADCLSMFAGKSMGPSSNLCMGNATELQNSPVSCSVLKNILKMFNIKTLSLHLIT